MTGGLRDVGVPPFLKASAAALRSARPAAGNRRRIDLGRELDDFYGRHRSGWIYAVGSLRPLHTRWGVKLDSFIERTFAWSVGHAPPHREPWVGFIHIPAGIPAWFQGYQSNESIFRMPAWRESLPLCRGLFTLSAHHRDDLAAKLATPVESLLFPTETPELTWSWERFRANPDRQIIQVGWWLRRLHSIYRLPTRRYRKVFLCTTSFDFSEILAAEREILAADGLFEAGMYRTATRLGGLDDAEYDRLLAENLVFLDLYQSSANNAVVECIVRNTPVLVNPLPAVVEYLGAGYPLYFRDLAEAAAKAEDMDLVLAAHRYLAGLDIKERLTGGHFLKSFTASDIYRSL